MAMTIRRPIAVFISGDSVCRSDAKPSVLPDGSGRPLRQTESEGGRRREDRRRKDATAREVDGTRALAEQFDEVGTMLDGVRCDHGGDLSGVEELRSEDDAQHGLPD